MEQSRIAIAEDSRERDIDRQHMPVRMIKPAVKQLISIWDQVGSLTLLCDIITAARFTDALT
jgi:hypothetical protein